MAVSCEPNVLAAAASGFDGGQSFQLKAIWVYLLCNLINGVTVTCDANTLATNAACFVGCLSEGQLNAVITYLLCQLAVGGGGGGGANNNVIYVADPNAEALVPPDQTKPSFTYSLNFTLPVMTWNTSTLSWQ